MKSKVLVVISIIASLAGVYSIKKYFENKQSAPTYLYKITSVDLWEQSKDQDNLVLSDMDSDFIHLATQPQISRIVSKFWKDASQVVVLTLETEKLPGNLVLEANPGGTTQFYHLYDAFIPHKAIIDVEIRNV